MANLQKISGTFVNTGDVVSLTLPSGAVEVALRLYDESLDIVIWSIVDPSMTTPAVTRTFQFIGTDELPTNFVKYIGSSANGHVIEVVV